MRASLFACLVALAFGARALSLDEDDHFHLEEDEEAEEGDDFTNSWVAEIRGGESVERHVAWDHGFTYKGLVAPRDDYFILMRDDHPEVSTQPNNHLSRKLRGENELRGGQYGAQPEYEEYDDEDEEDEEPYYPPRMANHEVMPAYAENVNDYDEDEDDYAYQQQQRVPSNPRSPQMQDRFPGEGFGGGFSRPGLPSRRPQGGTWSDDGATYSYQQNQPGYSYSYYESNAGRPGSYGRPQLGGMFRPGRPSGLSSLWDDDEDYFPSRPSRPQPIYSSSYGDDDLDGLTGHLQHSLGVLTGGRPRPQPPPAYSRPPPISSGFPPSMFGRPPPVTRPPHGIGRPPPTSLPFEMYDGNGNLITDPEFIEHVLQANPHLRPSYSPPPSANPQPPPSSRPPSYWRPPPAYSPPPPYVANPPPQQPPPYSRPSLYVQSPPAYSPPPPFARPPSIGGGQPRPGQQFILYDGDGNQITDPTIINYLMNNMKPGQGPQTFDMAELMNNANAAKQGDLSKLGTFGTQPVDAGVLSGYQGATPSIEQLSAKTSAYKDMFSDPLWKKQWYCQDYRTANGPVMDHNVVPVYKMGHTGQGVKVAVVDDGCELHPDLLPNMMRELNWDMNTRQPGATPEPGASHGTSCAGEIAMAANNGICGVGIAHEVKFAAVKKVGGMTPMYVEGSSLAYRPDVFDIYSNSWGPPDDGGSMEEIGHLNLMALKTGYFEGRGGKGAVYTFAGGNGRHNTDNCAADAFINSLYAWGIASATQRGKIAYYSERCSGILATTYSGGGPRDEGVASVDKGGGCTTRFSGTSAAVPIATGIIALTYSAKKELTARDVAHLIALSSEVAPLADNPDTWYRNGAGFWVSNDFGFGLMNAENMVLLAKKWKSVPDRHACQVKVKLTEPRFLSIATDVVVDFDTKGCADNPQFHVASLEEVMLKTVINYPYRGAISIHLTSPMKTKSLLLQTRPKDNRNRMNWEIKSFHNWGENPSGKWVIEVKANDIPGIRAGSGYAIEFTVTLWGTAEKPWYHAEGLVPRKYSAFRLSNGQTG